MYLLAFKNNEEREELYNGAVGREFSILVRNFSLTRHEGLEREKKGEEKKCQTYKNKTKQKVCVLHACFWCVLQNTLLRTFSKLFPGFTTFFSDIVFSPTGFLRPCVGI